jgi:hypothetical protein
MKNHIFLFIIFCGLFYVVHSRGQDMALELDGIDDYVEVLDAASLDLKGPMTIDLWLFYV